MSDVLTKRQAEVLDLVCVGLANKEIGAKLGLRESTVKDHMLKAMQKLGTRTRVQAALIWTQTRPDYITMWEIAEDGPLPVALPPLVVPVLPSLDPVDQFWALVRRHSGTCWIWEGSLYGGRTPHCTLPGFEEIGTNARRIAYALEKGERVPEGQRIAMTCSVVRCVFPGHMRVVSVQNRPHFDRVFGRKVTDGKGSRKE